MNIASNGTALAALTKELAQTWAQTKENWRDTKSDEFERKYLAELMGSMNRVSAVFEQLHTVVSKARKDCE